MDQWRTSRRLTLQNKNRIGGAFLHAPSSLCFFTLMSLIYNEGSNHRANVIVRVSRPSLCFSSLIFSDPLTLSYGTMRTRGVKVLSFARSGAFLDWKVFFFIRCRFLMYYNLEFMELVDWTFASKPRPWTWPRVPILLY